MRSVFVFTFSFCFKSLCVEGQLNIQEELVNRILALERQVSGQAKQLQDHEERLANKECDCSGTTTGKSLAKRFVVESDGPVAFTAAIPQHVINDVKPMETIKFERMITSIGGGYNNLTGVFVAPMSGIYVFSCSLLDHIGDHLATNGAMVHAEIVHNQRILGRIFAHATQSYRDQGAQTVFAKVNQGDQVWVRSIENPDLGLGGDLYSTFSGYLLLPM